MPKSKTKSRKRAAAVAGAAPCYAIVCCDNKITLAYGVSVIAAWNAAEDMTGEKTKTLRKHGYKLVKSRWHNGEIRGGSEPSSASNC